jgi:type III secretion protein V
VAGIVAIMILPLPTLLLDLLIALNLTFAVLVLLQVSCVSDPLRIATFPTLLLITTLYRLGLNISSTRLILLQADAGQVIDAFGRFVVRGNYVVGAVVFVILIVVQLVVIAKGSERVAEVAARFTLDALPGQQLAIDADVRAGLIDQTEASRRRRALQRESQFYGAMDGAMRFVKGDAIAGVVITVTNIGAGLAVGVVQLGMTRHEALVTYGLLTIGDGLVSQLPALVMATSAGLVITRVTAEEEGTPLPDEVIGQFRQPRPWAIAAALLFLLSATPGLPPVPFLLWGILCATAAVVLSRRSRRPSSISDDGEEEKGRTVIGTVPTVIEVSSLVEELDRGGGAAVWPDTLAAAGQKLQRELGVPFSRPQLRIVPAVSRKEAAFAYRILIDEVVELQRPLDWLTQENRKRPLVDVLDEDMQRIWRRRAHLFVGLHETQALVDQLEGTQPALVRAVVPQVASLPLVAEVLRRLAHEGVSIGNLRLLFESLLQWAPEEKDPRILTERVRSNLSRQISAHHAGEGRLRALFLSPEIEETIRQGLHGSATGSYLVLSPERQKAIVQAIGHRLAELSGTTGVVVLSQPDVRSFVRQLIETEYPDTAVLSRVELEPTVIVQLDGQVSLPPEAGDSPLV